MNHAPVQGGSYRTYKNVVFARFGEYFSTSQPLAKQELVSVLKPEDGKGAFSHFYTYDAQGNPMATYSRTQNYVSSAGNNHLYNEEFMLDEQMIYGSSRLGVRKAEKVIVGAQITQTSLEPLNIDYEINTTRVFMGIFAQDYSNRRVGNKYYELSNHLGNVLVVVTDRKLGSVDETYYTPDVVSYSDYYPYGSLLDNRHGSVEDYRYGFNGMEADDEIKNVKGSSYDFGARMYDPRVGRWFAQDKVVKSALSPYQFGRNNGIIYVDSDGNDELYFTIHNANTDKVYVEATYIKTKDEALKIYVVTGNSVGHDPRLISKDIASHPGVIRIKPYEGTSFFPDQGSYKAAENKLPLAFDSRVLQALDDYSYMGKLITLTGNVEAFEIDLYESGARTGLPELIGGSAAMDASMTVTEYTGFLEGAFGIVVGTRMLTKTLIKETTKELAKTGSEQSAKYVFKTTMKEGDLEFIAVKIGDETLEFGGIMVKKDGILTIKEFDVDAGMTNTFGIKKIVEVMSEFGKEMGVSKVIVEGAARTTGSKPGKITTLTFDVK